MTRVGLIVYNVDGKAGMERQATQLAARLAARGLRLRVVSTAAPREWPALVRRPMPIAGPEVPVARLPITRAPAFELAARAWLAAQGGVDVLYGVGWHGGLHAARIARRTGTPIVVKYACSGPHGDLAALGALPAERALVLGAERQVCISAAIRAEALAAGVAPDRLVDIPNGVDCAAWAQDERPAALPWPAGDPVVLFVGRLTRQKRVDVLLRAFARVATRVPAARLALAGAGPLQGELLALTRELGLVDRVAFLGPRGDVLALHRAASVFVLPSEGEGMPNVLLEAIAAGTPSVATDVDGTNEVARHEREALLVPVGDDAALAGALARLLTDRPLALRLADAGRARARELFDLETVADAYAALLIETARWPRALPTPGLPEAVGALARALRPRSS